MRGSIEGARHPRLLGLPRLRLDRKHHGRFGATGMVRNPARNSQA